MTKKFRAKLFACLILLFIFIFPFLIVSAAPNLNYTPMEKIPGMTTTTEYDTNADFATFISNVYKFGIWVVGICALIMIVIGGYMYAASGGNNASMEKAKGFITDAIVGLILALLAYLILYIINPELVRIKMAVATPPTTPPTIPGPPPSLPPSTPSACQNTNSQVPSQCADASDNLNKLINCVNKELEKVNKKVQISSISDGNGGVNCYKNNPTWSQCTASKQTYCCFHKKNSCHYGGTSGKKSCAVDYSTRGSSATNAEINQAVSSCSGSAINEGNHVHASASGCGCT
jgi:hypothetical protein